MPRVVVLVAGADVEEAPDAEEAPEAPDAEEAPDVEEAPEVEETSDTEETPDDKDEVADDEVSVPVASFPRVVVLGDGLEDELLVDADADADELGEVAAVPADVELEEEAPEDVEADVELADDDEDALALADEDALALADEDVLPDADAFAISVLSSVNAMVGLLSVPPEYTYPCADAPGGVGSPHLTAIDLTREVKCPPAAV